MTFAPVQASPPAFRLDLSWPILIASALVLCALILAPLGWLAYFSLVDRAGDFTLGNFRQLVTTPAFVEPLITTVVLSVSASFICCVVAAPLAWLVARTDMPLRGAVRALMTASFVTPPFLGAIAWELLAAPNSGLLNQTYRCAHRRGAGRAPVQHLYAHRADLCHVVLHRPYVFVLVANALERIPAIWKTHPPSWAAARGRRPDA